MEEFVKRLQQMKQLRQLELLLAVSNAEAFAPLHCFLNEFGPTRSIVAFKA